MHQHRSSSRSSSRLLAGLVAIPLAAGALISFPTSAASAEELPIPTVSYNFEGDLADATDHGRDAEPREGQDPTFDTGVNGQALTVTQGKNYVSLPNDVQPSAAGMTASFWYKQAEHSSDGAVFSNQDWRTGTNPGITLANRSTESAAAYVSLNGNRAYDLFDLETGTLESLPAWNHITIVVDGAGQTQSTYRNGALVKAIDVGERTLASGLPFRIGSDGSGTIMDDYPGTWVSGSFDDFAFYDVPLNAQQVSAAFRSVAPEGVVPEDGSVTILPAENGSSTASLQGAGGGEVVTLTATPAEGYHLGEWVAVHPANLIVSANKFTMPDSGYVQIQPRFDPDLPVPTVPEGTSKQKVLMVGVDGLAWEHIPQFNMPSLDGIQASGLAGSSYLYAPTFAETSSGPGYATQLTGVWPDKSGVVDNTFAGNKLAEYPDMLTRMEQLDPELSTISTASWLALYDNGVFGNGIDVAMPVNPSEYPGYPAADEAATIAMQEILSTQNPDVAYVYYGAPDAEGHTHGRDTHQYQIAAENTDDRIGRLLEAVQSRASYADEEWVVMVAPDHGFIGTGHGGPTLDERRVFVYATGTGIPNQVNAERDPEIVDVAATALTHMGFELDPVLDGIPIGTASKDPFDAMKPNLQEAVDATGPGAAYSGWTHETPEGWSINNDAMGTGGISEWGGWSLTTDVFWSGTNQLEEREHFVRGRDLWAVADPDAWGGADHTGGFDSTLTSEPYNVAGLDSTTVSFMTQYRPADGQAATVSVSFDGGENTEIATLTAAITSELVTTEVPVPEGAKQMTVSWQLVAPSDGWFWAIDNPQVDVAEVAPTVTIKESSLGSNGVYREVSFEMTDDVELDKFVLNDTETKIDGGTRSDLDAVTPGVSGAVEGDNTLAVYDVAGNVATVEFALDVTAPVATIKPESIGKDDVYESVSFTLSDAGQLSKYTLNGVETDLESNTSADLDGVKPGSIGAVEGANTLDVADVAGNVTTVEFTLTVQSSPEAPTTNPPTEPPAESQTDSPTGSPKEPSSGSPKSGELANTGGELGALIAAGLGVLGLGAFLTIAGLRRRRNV